MEVKEDRCCYYCNGLLHRENDMPAMTISDDYFAWCLLGITRRNYGLPSIILSSNFGDYKWTDSTGRRIRSVYGLRGCLVVGDKHEVLSFTGFINEGGTMRKYDNGVYHRENDMPTRVTESGSMAWHIEGKLNRLYGLPCLITNKGERIWFEEDSNGNTNRTRSISLSELNGALVIGIKDSIVMDDII